MNLETNLINAQDESRYPYFKGYPYLVIHVLGRLFHINLLSEKDTQLELVRLAQAQADANKFEVCLVIDEKTGAYFSSKHGPHFSEQIPKGGIFTINQLRLATDPPATDNLLRRKEELRIFIENTKPKSGYLLGDLQKGGREATPEELVRLRGAQENQLPKGIEICPVCETYRGECLDPSPQLRGLVVKVSCFCENNVLCARCRNKLHERRPNSNSYNSRDGHIWHTPSFCGLNHQCP